MTLVQHAAGTAIEAGLAWRNARTADLATAQSGGIKKRRGIGASRSMPVRRWASDISAGVWKGWQDDLGVVNWVNADLVTHICPRI